MDVIHFTRGAADPLTGPRARGVRSVPLAVGEGIMHLGALHLDPGAMLDLSLLGQAVLLLVVHGRVELSLRPSGVQSLIHAGMGAVLQGNEACALGCTVGAIALLLEASGIEADPCGVSTPERIKAQRWPSDVLLKD